MRARARARITNPSILSQRPIAIAYKMFDFMGSLSVIDNCA
jgi:hypothetical protein